MYGDDSSITTYGIDGQSTDRDSMQAGTSDGVKSTDLLSLKQDTCQIPTVLEDLLLGLAVPDMEQCASTDHSLYMSVMDKQVGPLLHATACYSALHVIHALKPQRRVTFHTSAY